MTSNGELEVVTKCAYCGDELRFEGVYRKYHDGCRELARRARRADWYQERKSLDELHVAEMYWELGEIRTRLLKQGMSLQEASERARKLIKKG